MGNSNGTCKVCSLYKKVIYIGVMVVYYDPHQTTHGKIKMKVMKMGLMASFVSFASMGCQSEERVEVLTVTSVDQCISSGIDLNTCQSEWDRATSMHEDVAPKFDTAGGCYGEFGDMCQNRPVTHADGTTSNVWLPMMAGMMMGNMMSGSVHAANQANTRPLYMNNARKTPQGTYVGGLVTPSGNPIAAGKSYMSKSAAMSSPTRATVASTKSAVSSRGGFGASARGGSGAS